MGGQQRALEGPEKGHWEGQEKDIARAQKGQTEAQKGKPMARTFWGSWSVVTLHMANTGAPWLYRTPQDIMDCFWQLFWGFQKDLHHLEMPCKCTITSHQQLDNKIWTVQNSGPKNENHKSNWKISQRNPNCLKELLNTQSTRCIAPFAMGDITLLIVIWMENLPQTDGKWSVTNHT